MESISTFDGDWTISMIIRLNSIVWNDTFHGISILDDTGFGVSFGYSQYGSLFVSQHTAQNTSTAYGPGGSLATGQWLHWEFQKEGDHLTILVDGEQVLRQSGGGFLEGSVHNGSRIHFPGRYADGDGLPHEGITSSDLDSFSLVPEPSAALLAATALVTLAALRRRRV